MKQYPGGYDDYVRQSAAAARAPAAAAPVAPTKKPKPVVIAVKKRPLPGAKPKAEFKCNPFAGL